MFTVTKCVLKSKNSEITPCIKPHHVYHVYNPKLCLQIRKSLKLVLVSIHVMLIIKIGSTNQKCGEITSCIKPHDVNHVYSDKMCLEIKNVMKLLLVSMLVTSNIMYNMFTMTRRR